MATKNKINQKNIVNQRKNTKDYIEKIYQNLDQFQELRSTAPQNIQHMQLSHAEARIVSTLVKLHKPNNILEIGSFVGYSTAHIINSLINNDGKNLDQSLRQNEILPLIKKKKFVTIEKNSSHFSQLQRNIKKNFQNDPQDEKHIITNFEKIFAEKIIYSPLNSGNIPERQNINEKNNSIIDCYKNSNLEIFLVKADAQDALHILRDTFFAGEKIDLMFIDGAKNHYPNYLDFAAKNIKSGGLLIADNTLLFGAMNHYSKPEAIEDKKLQKMWKNMHFFNQKLVQSRHFHSIILPTTEGLTVAIKN